MNLTNFNAALEDAIRQLRARVRESVEETGLNNIKLEIVCEGRVLDGKTKVTFAVGEHFTGVSDAAEGHDLETTLEEFLRRKGWSKRQAPLMIEDASQTAETADADDDNIPF